jgi:ferredoxin
MDMEVDAGSDVRMVAQVHCRGSRETSSYLYEYHGVKDCNAAYMLFEGDKECKYGCLGYGSCMKVCPTDAIYYDKEGLVRVDRDKCIGCEKCVDVCPTGVMKMIPYDADFIVACNSTDKPAVVRKYCKVGCIGCKICEKKSPEGGYKVENFLATIDYTQKGDRSAGAEACPVKCIIVADDSLRTTDKKEEKAEIEKEETKKVMNAKA